MWLDRINQQNHVSGWDKTFFWHLLLFICSCCKRSCLLEIDIRLSISASKDAGCPVMMERQGSARQIPCGTTATRKVTLKPLIHTSRIFIDMFSPLETFASVIATCAVEVCSLSWAKCAPGWAIRALSTDLSRLPELSRCPKDIRAP